MSLDFVDQKVKDNMSELVRSLVGRFYGAFNAPRSAGKCSVRLPLNVSLSELASPDGGQWACAGHTCDLSRTGLSFVLPTVRLGGRHIFSEGGAVLRITLELPSGSVNMEATAVRYDLFDGPEEERAYIIGALIVDMKGDDRVRYLEFLRAPQHAANVAAQFKTANPASAA